jgi:hypothetical protein
LIVFIYIVYQTPNLSGLQMKYSAESKCVPYNLDGKFETLTFDIDGIRYPLAVPLYHNKTIDFKCLSKVKRNFSIVIYTIMDDGLYDFDVNDFQNPNLLKSLECPITNCHFTYEKNESMLSDAVLYNFRNWPIDFPVRPSQDQIWIFYSTESPVHFPIENILQSNYDNASYFGAFNWTATYRFDSDAVSFFYAKSMLEWSYSSEFDENYDFFAAKTEFAANIASTCYQASNRHILIDQLKMYVNVSVFGGCGVSCPVPNEDWGSFGCKEYVAEKFKFYLAFENSVCKSYITEKFFDVLRLNIVPVVYGAGPYDRYVPKSGFINVFDFKTVNELADYLAKVGNDRNLYNSYFKWKKYVKFEYKKPKPIRGGQFCDMCIKMNLHHVLGSPKSHIPDIRKYWENDGNCQNGIQFENGIIPRLK